MGKHYKARNQFSNRPPFCDFLERYQKAHKKVWAHSHLSTVRIGMGRFDEWLKVSQAPLQELNWHKLMEFYRFLAAQGVSGRAAARSVQVAKHALRWGIKTGELPQKVEDLYTFHYSRHSWDDIPLPSVAERFLEELEVLKPATHKHYSYALRVFHCFLAEKGLTYRRLKRNHMVMYLKYLDEKGFKAHGKAMFCGKTRNYLRWLYEHRKIKRHCDDILPSRFIPKKDRRLPRPLDPELDQRLQEILKETDDIFYKAILLLRRTGLRISELRKLEFNCIQYDEKGRASLKVPPVKLGVERRVPLDPTTIDLIHRIQAMSHANHRNSEDPRWLVIGQSGLPPRYEKYSEAMTELCARLDTKKWINLHALRHTYATSLLNAGLSITSLKEILGHKTITMTLLYAKVTQGKLKAEYEQALKLLNEAQIPKLLVPKSVGVDSSFSELAAHINKAIDKAASPPDRKKLKGLMNRLSKIKSDLKKAQNTG